ncbi:hypothetical protein Ab1vBOLIVR4_gp55 [Agrobacterium phage OLIVR4]|nr:hypothetical protein Ab1vBOLIVR4_gp55 [Agrobacterium phage OLIVR4]
MKEHQIEVIPLPGPARFEWNQPPADAYAYVVDEATAYPHDMKWRFDLPLMWQGKSAFEQVYKDLTAVRRLRAFLKPVAAPVSDLWTSAAYPMGVPVERRYYTGNVVEPTAQDIIDHFNGVRDPKADAFNRLMYGYCVSDVRETARQRENILRWNLNSIYGSLYRGR